MLILNNYCMNICNYTNCECKVYISKIGFCKYCSKNFCNIHRLQEIHCCVELESCKSISKNNLSIKLINEKTCLKKNKFN